MTALEKAAKAIIDLDGRHGLAYTEAAAERLALRYARAVLLAIREPDQATHAAGNRITDLELAPSWTARQTFTAMIDHILKEATT